MAENLSRSLDDKRARSQTSALPYVLQALTNLQGIGICWDYPRASLLTRPDQISRLANENTENRRIIASTSPTEYPNKAPTPARCELMGLDLRHARYRMNPSIGIRNPRTDQPKLLESLWTGREYCTAPF